MLRLENEARDAERRYHDASKRGDVAEMKAAAEKWTAADRAASQYAFEHVEPFNDK